MLENGLYCQTKTNLAIIKVAKALNLDHRTIYSWYADPQFRDWLDSAYRAYHLGMAELFALKIYQRGTAPNATLREEQVALNAAIRTVTMMIKTPDKSQTTVEKVREMVKKISKGETIIATKYQDKISR